MGTPKQIERISYGICFVFLIGLAFVFLTPFLWGFLTAFKPAAEVFSSKILPSRLSLDSVRTVLTIIPFFKYLFNSVFVGTVSTILSLFLCSLAGFAFAKYDFPLKFPLFVILLSTMMIPFHVIMVPLFLFMNRIGWIDTYYAIIIPFAASPIGIFLMRQYLKGIPSELIDAARIDGCSEFRIYYGIILPLCKPVLGVLTIFLFTSSWNNFLWPLIVLRSPEKFTLPLGLANLMLGYGLEYGSVIAGGVLGALPMIIVFLLMQRQFISGLTMGAVKG